MPDIYPKWKFYPSWRTRPSWVASVVEAVRGERDRIDSTQFVGSTYQQSNDVLAILKDPLERLGFTIEGPGVRGTMSPLRRPVLYREQDEMDKFFDIDGWHEDLKVALEVEASKAYESKNAVWDLIKYCLIQDVEYGVIIVPTRYEPRKTVYTPPFDAIRRDFDSIYANPERLRIPLNGLLLIGY